MTTAPRSPRTVHVEHCMGTTFSIDIRDGTGGERPDRAGAVGAVVAWLHHVDAVFSTYRPDSDISRIRRGELRPADADPDVAVVLDLCARAQIATGGHFTALIAGAIDPTGLVKGWAVEQAGRLLRGFGSTDHAVNGGGDVQLAGESAPGRAWRVGITDPRDRTRVCATVAGRDFAVATSGSSERGAHVVDPFTGRPATGHLSATVVGPSLALADVYATAAFVMGRRALRWIEDVDGYDLLLISADGTQHTSKNWAARQRNASTRL